MPTRPFLFGIDRARPCTKALAVVIAGCILLGLAGCRLPPWQEKSRPLTELERRDQERRGGRIRLSDLRPRNVSAFVSGQTVTIRATVRNQGRAATGPFDVVVSLEPSRQPTFRRTVQSLAAGADERIDMGQINAPPAGQTIRGRWLLEVDPPTPGRARGREIEEDEGNNVEGYDVTVFGVTIR